MIRLSTQVLKTYIWSYKIDSSGADSRNIIELINTCKITMNVSVINNSLRLYSANTWQRVMPNGLITKKR